MKTKGVICLLALFFIQTCFAWSWTDLWLTPNQQAEKALKEGKTKQAAKLFQNPQWQGVANYRGENYQKALQAFSSNKTAFGYYNQGNALAHLRKYKEAIAAYDRALKLTPDFENAKFNKELIEKLLKQQQQSKQNQKNKSQSKFDKNKQANNRQQSKEQSKSKNSQQSQQTKQQQKSSQRNQNPNGQRQNNPQKDKQQANNSQASEKQSSNRKKQKQSQSKAKSQAEEMRQQATKRWLNQIPDNPGGLLRQKFLRDHLRIQQQEREI